jgi:hypothetical protein
LKYIISITFFIGLNCSAAIAQGKYVPNGIRVGANLKTLATTLTNDQIVNNEITGDINFHNYFLTVDLGQARMKRQAANFAYLTSGNYYTAGIDINFLHNMEGNNSLGLGIRYARSDYLNELSWSVTDTLWGAQTVHARNGQVSSQWFESLVHLKVDTWYNVQLGFTFGLKFGRSIRGTDNLEVYEIPGYGLAEAATLWSFNYYIYYYIPFRR